MIGFKAFLSDGSIIKEWEHGSTTEPPWLYLKRILKEKNLKINDLQLIFNHQVICTRPHARIYFYAKKVEAWVIGQLPQKHYYGVGVESGHGKVEITWYDGENSVIEIRDYIDADIGMIRNE